VAFGVRRLDGALVWEWRVCCTAAHPFLTRCFQSKSGFSRSKAETACRRQPEERAKPGNPPHSIFPPCGDFRWHCGQASSTRRCHARK
jgi:hypothetical protein